MQIIFPTEHDKKMYSIQTNCYKINGQNTILLNGRKNCVKKNLYKAKKQLLQNDFKAKRKPIQIDDFQKRELVVRTNTLVSA